MNKGAVVFLGLVIVSLFLIFNNQKNFNKNVVGVSPSPIVSSQIYEHGEYVCLPHKDKTGPQTLECALGLKSHEGEYFALDTSSIDQNYIQKLQVGAHVFIEGDFVPVEALSSDHWQTYDIKGIVKVVNMGEH